MAAPDSHSGGDPDPRGRWPQRREPCESMELGRWKASALRRDRPDASGPLTPPGSPRPSMAVRDRASGSALRQGGKGGALEPQHAACLVCEGPRELMLHPVGTLREGGLRGPGKSPLTPRSQASSPQDCKEKVPVVEAAHLGCREGRLS